jgi:hypothetical protein
VGGNIIKTIITRSEKVKALKNKARNGDMSKPWYLPAVIISNPSRYPSV